MGDSRRSADWAADAIGHKPADVEDTSAHALFTLLDRPGAIDSPRMLDFGHRDRRSLVSHSCVEGAIAGALGSSCDCALIQFAFVVLGSWYVKFRDGNRLLFLLIVIPVGAILFLVTLVRLTAK